MPRPRRPISPGMAGLLVSSAAILGGALCYLACGANSVATGGGSDAGQHDVLRHFDGPLPADDSAAGVDASYPSDGPWVHAPQAGACPLYIAQTPPFGTRTWASCGTGCQIAPAWPAPMPDVGLVVGSGGAYMGGDSYLQISNDDQPQLVEILRLSDNTTLAAARINSIQYECLFAGPGQDAPFLLLIGQTNGSYLFGRASLEAGAPVQWQSSWVPGSDSIVTRFLFDSGCGMGISGGQVDWLPSASAPQFTVLDSTISPLDFTSARGLLLVWDKNDSSHGWLQSFVNGPGATPSTLVALPVGSSVNAVRTTDDRVVWITVGGPQWQNGVYASARIDWLKYVAQPTPSLTTLQEPPGPTIPSTMGLHDLAAGDDYAATQGCDPPDDAGNQTCNMYVAQLSTGQVWKLPQRPGGNVFRSVLAISPTEIVLSEQDAQPLKIQQWFKRIVRLQIAHLNDIVASW